MTRRIASVFLLLIMTLTAALPSMADSLRPAGKAEKLGYQPGDTMIVIPAFVRMIPPYCFAGCDGLRRVRFAEGSQLGQIARFAFAECEDLVEFDMPSGVKAIGEGAFRGCRNLRSINLPEAIFEISRETFAYCRSLETISLPAGLRSIKPLAFLDCQSLQIDRLPAGVTSIGNNAFGRCFSIRSMILPAGCSELESYAFADCTGLETITLPAKVKMLGELMFSGCTRLRQIICRAIVPPIIECNSFLFEPDDSKAWRDCRVIVPAGRRRAYSLSPFWSRFKHLSEVRP